VTDVERIFHELTGELDYAMMIVTTTVGGEHSGCLVGFATQCSIDPPRFLVCLSDKNHTLGLAQRSDSLAVHFLAATDTELAELFGSQTGDEIDKFARCRWQPGPAGLPILSDCARWLAGRVVDRYTFGDHVGFVLEPFAAEHRQTGAHFTYQRARWLEPGHPA
jgi:flavin reductase (DIM6/NTAB) family NADH-FMN oxidoreductase RutF